MKLKKEGAAGSKIAVRGGILVHDKDGICEVEDKEICDRLISQGWELVGDKSKAEPKPKPKAEPKKEDPKKEAPKKEPPKKESPKVEPKAEEKEAPKEEVIPKRERPSFKRGNK